MQESTALLFEVAFPHPRVLVTLNQAPAALELELGSPKEKAVPDSGMKPAAMGSEFHA
jgi:hypothetical protein